MIITTVKVPTIRAALTLFGAQPIIGWAEDRITDDFDNRRVPIPNALFVLKRISINKAHAIWIAQCKQKEIKRRLYHDHP